MYDTFSYLILQMNGTYIYQLQKCFLRNTYCLIIRKELQDIVSKKKTGSKLFRTMKYCEIGTRTMQYKSSLYV